MNALHRLIVERDPTAAGEVVDGALPNLASFLCRRHPGLALEDARDLAQEALALALENRERFDPTRGASVDTWLHGIAKIKALDFLRKRGNQVGLDEASERPVESAPEGKPNGELRGRIERAIANLPPQQRRAAERHYLDGRTPRDVEIEYGWRPNTANVYLSHARRALRRTLAGGGNTPTMAYGCTSRSRLRLRRLRFGSCQLQGGSAREGTALAWGGVAA